MATRLQLCALEFAQALLRGFGFLALAVVTYLVLHRAGVWYPMVVEDYWWVALSCAVSLALWRRFPLVHLLLVAAFTGNPWWSFSVGEIRAVPLVLAAFLTSYAGLRAAVALPLVAAAALSGEFPRWVWLVHDPSMWPDFVIQNGLSLPLLVTGLTVFAALVGRSLYVQLRGAESLRAQNEELTRLRESDRERIASEERTVIAREVHDIVAHHLAAIVVRAQAAARVAEAKPEEPRAAVEWIADAGPRALAEMRSLVQVLRGRPAPESPGAGRSAWTRGALSEGIDALIERVRSTGVEVRAVVDVPGGMSAVQEFAVLRVCQEALTNVLVHSGAGAVDVRLAATGDDAVLVVEDDGAAIGRPVAVPQAAPALRFGSEGGSGIPGMRERAKAAGGTVTAGWSARGWRVQLVLPRTPDQFGEAASA